LEPLGWIKPNPLFKAYYEKTNTNTTPIVPKDLEVKKYTLKYQYKINPKERLSLSYAIYDDPSPERRQTGGDYLWRWL